MENNKKRIALQFIFLLGIVSLFGDITYEGARSIAGPYLGMLGASAAAIGLVAGLGEFLGYVLRLASGYVADRAKAYWPLTILGYGLLCAIPLMAFAGQWHLAALLLILERIGKGIRAPARDAILSHATKLVGRGLGFGIHEAVDQIGAVIGPLIFSAVALYTGSYRDGFVILWIPALLCMATLLLGRAKVPSPIQLEASEEEFQNQCEPETKLPRIFWLYGLFAFLSVAGFANFQIISYHFKLHSVVSDSQIPLLYAIAMGIDAVMGLLIGRIYDRVGLLCLAAVPILTLPIPFLAFTHSYSFAVISVVLWGAVMGIHETVMRAAIADLTGVEKRGTAYGLFNTIYGGAWFLGGAVMGILYDYSILSLFLFTMVIEGISVGLFFIMKKEMGVLKQGNKTLQD
jgi:MFS family permease